MRPGPQVTLWHFYQAGAEVAYCGQKVSLSAARSISDAFTAEAASSVVYDTGDGFGDAESAGGNAIAVDMESARFVRHWCGRSTQGDTAHFLEVKVDVILDVRGSTDRGASYGSAAAGSLQLAYPLVSDNSGVAPPAVVADAAGAEYVQPQELRFPYSGPARDVATTLHYRAVDDSGQAAVCAVQVVVG